MPRITRGVAATCALTGIALAVPSAAYSAGACSNEAITGLNVPHFTVASATSVAAKDMTPAHCNVEGAVATDGDGAGPNSARLRMELPEKWNGKLVFFGVGGLAGSLSPSANPGDFGSALGRGYATAITDTGHVGQNPFDASWILKAPGEANEAKIVDYFYRAPHQATVAAKLIAAGFYGAPKVSRAYFDGCSFGGHMGLMEAMRYPDDYDGVIAGAPYMDNYTQLWGYKNAKAFLNAYVPAEVVAKVNDAVVAACDAEDGAKDGLIQNPAKCTFDPQSLVPSVLTQAQADAFKTFMRPVTDARGHMLYPGSPISDLAAANGPAGGFMGWVEAASPASNPAGPEPWAANPPVLWAAAEGFIKPIDLRDPNLDFNSEWPEKNGQISDEALSQFDERMGVGNADQPERLAPFFAAGKKLILYHGYGDTAISPFRTIWFYEDLAKGMGGYANAGEHARLFMVPGMLHCLGGDGPSQFDTLSALEAWVEQGKAPDAIVAAKPAADPQAKPVRTMPLCPFPAQAAFKGTADVNSAENWTCPDEDASQLETGSAGIVSGMGEVRK